MNAHSPSHTSDLLAEPPQLDVAAAQRRLLLELSQGSKTGTLLLLLTASMSTVAVSSLWLTENGLPLRTQLAFAFLTSIGLGWSIFFGWVLSRRQLLFAYHRVVAGRMATLASTLFTAGALVLAATNVSLRPAATLASLMGMGMVVVAMALLRAAQARHRDLLTLREWIESRLRQPAAG